MPESVLEKDAPLSEGEAATIRSHTVAGERIIAAAPGLASVASCSGASSERFDGSGYPDGLAGESIPPGARSSQSQSPSPHSPRSAPTGRR